MKSYQPRATRGLATAGYFYFKPSRDLKNVFCLNLDRSPKRWARMKDYFLYFGISASRRKAVDGHELAAIPNINMAEVAISQGHRKMWLECLEKQQPVAIFEDDVIFCRKFKSHWQARLPLPKGIDILYLGMSWPQVSQHFYLPGLMNVVYFLGGFAYVLFPSGAAKLVKEHCKSPLKPVDHLIAGLLQSGKLQAIAPYPSWCVAQWAESLVEERPYSPYQRFGNIFEDPLETTNGGSKDWAEKGPKSTIAL